MIKTDADTRPAFSSISLDRRDDIRVDPAKLHWFFKDSRAVRLVLDGLDPAVDEGQLVREPIPRSDSVDDYILLGQQADERPLFVALRRDIPHGGQFAPRVWEAATELSSEELSLYGCARSLVDWHARHGFCAVCGSPTLPVKAGWARKCGGCGAEHFPRVDPVVIMLAEHDGRVLIGRQPRFPAGRYSALAGFVEPGETFEGAVIRELFEEAGVRARDVRYVMDQPWPFPSSLMIACMAQVDDDRLTLDTTEIEDAMWVSADEVRAALAGHADARFIAPPRMAVARHLLLHWVNQQP